jgi:hypothetical protein
MLDDLALILTSVGAASGAVALLRRRARRHHVFQARAGARHLAEALSAVAAEPLTVAAPTWKSLAETLEPETCERLS